MSDDYSLKVFDNVLVGSGSVAQDVVLTEWRRSTTFFGGPWMGSFKLTGNLVALQDWFYAGLGRHVEESSRGQTPWEGYIWEMDLVEPAEYTVHASSLRGRRQRRTLEGVFNRVKTVYTDPSDDNATGETSWYEDTVSQGLYGKKEEILYIEGTPAHAQNRAQEFLKYSSVSQPVTVGIEGNVTEAFLEVTVVGYVTTARYRFTQTANNTSDAIADWIEAIFDTDLEFLTTGRVASNTATVYRYQSQTSKALDLLEALVTLQGPSDERYYFNVEPGRIINYLEWDPTPIGLFWNGRFATMDHDSLEEQPRLFQPGIYRHTNYLPSQYASMYLGDTAFFEKPTDFLVDTVEVTEKGVLVPKLGLYDAEESLRSFVFEEEDLPDEILKRMKFFTAGKAGAL